jgi:signal transduction histidine kinase
LAAGRAGARPAPEFEATVYRIVQEALTNVVKHADASRARVRVEERDGAVAVVVEDDGRGIAEPDDGRGGFGLLGMRERAAMWGGEVEISPSDGGGTRVSARLPVERRPG